MSDDTKLAGVFNDYFINIAANLKEPIENTYLSKLKSYISSKVPDNFHFELPDIDENFVFKFLSTLDVAKATGLDGVGPRLLKLPSSIIAKSLTVIVNKCPSSGRFPSIWKQAKVSPLHKGAILTSLSKLLEKFKQKHFMSYLDSFDLIHESQSGFRTGHSTETALFLMTERWLKH